MNKNRFRIIFNQLRGLMMVVSENTKSHTTTAESGKTSAAASLSPSFTKDTSLTLRPLAFSLMLALGTAVMIIPNPVNISHAHAEVKAATNVPGNQRPTVLNAPNGVEVVNIQTPSAAGVSRNVYEILNVPTRGMIFNNSRTNVQTELGGWIQGNPWLATGSARIILNEINSSHPSYLNGFMEVAGSRAELIIANPNGISCNGCGFINASRGVLTTGAPILSGGDLTGYRVTGGTVNVWGNGLDASRSNYTDIIARAVEVNAGIWANDLKITTGANQVNVANTQATAITGSGATPSFALDVAALGGMYVGKITMIGTEAGLGVRNAGVISANAGHLTLDINGNLTNSNTIAGTTQTNIQADHINNTGGRIISQQQLELNAISLSGDGQILVGGNATVNLIDNYTHTASGALQANGNLSLSTAGNLLNQSAILAGQALTIHAANIDNTVSGELSGLNTYIDTTGGTGTAIGTLTNRGLIDGSDTFIHTGTLNNLGTGAIFGDHVAIAADTLNNLDETVNGVTTAAVIAARDQLDIGAANITNRNDALIFSAGNMAIGGSLDANHQATVATGQTQATTLINSGATIEALSNLQLSVADLQNLNPALVTQEVQIATGSFHRFTPRGTSVVLDANNYPLWQIGNQNISWRYGSTYNEPFNFREYYRYIGSTTTTETQVVASNPGQILSGGNLNISGNVTNSDSQIIAGGLLDVTEAAVQNLNSEGSTVKRYAGNAYYYDYDGSGSGFRYDVDYLGAYNPANEVQTFNLNISKLAGLSPVPGTGTIVSSVNPNTALPNNSLFHTNPNPTAGYYVETDPRFANYKTWLSSDYMLKALSYDPATVTKRLGDGFYEQRLIREQIAQLTGQRFLAGYSSDEEAYQALMTNGITFAQTYQLIPGVALSEAQIAQLTSDIVWLVEKSITLADGTTVQALVPQVYVRLQPGDINGQGTLLAGDSINLKLSGDPATGAGGTLINSGSIAGRTVVSITADNIHNLGGRISANNTRLNAATDINNLGGSIQGNDLLSLQAGHDINIASTTQSNASQSGLSSFSRTNFDRVAGLYVDNPNGILVASSGNNINLQGAIVSNSGTNGITVLDAGNNLNLTTITTAEQNNTIKNSKNYIKHGNTQEIGSVIQTEGDLILNAGNNVSARAANVTSEQGNLTVNAANDIHIEAGEATSNLSAGRTTKKSGTFSSKKTTSRDSYNDTEVISSTFSGDSVDMNAGNNLTVTGSNVVGTNNVNLNAGNNVTLDTAQATHDETHYSKTKQSGFSASGTSIGYSTSQLTNTNDSQQVINVGSTVGSVQGDVNITSGKDTRVTGSDLIAAQDINITGQNVTLDSVNDTYANQQTMKYKQSGISLSISAPAITAVQSAQAQVERSGEVKDDKLQALYAIKAAQNIVKAAEVVQDIASSSNPAEKSGVKLSLSIGTSTAKSSSTSTETVAKGSTLTAARDINITATGDAATANGNITMQGTTGNAGRDINLDAANDINLLSAANTSNQQSKNKSSSAGVGIAIGADKDGAGISVFANASSSKGKANGNGTTHTETTLQANDTLSITSGHDTALKGAIVGGNTIVADIGTNPDTGGNLKLESEQDSANYKSKQTSVSGGISYTFGAGTVGGSLSVGKEKVNSTYDSVIEQTAIQAGDGGFNINVAGNTHLKGAVIDSTLTAQSAGNNQLTTQTLTTESIKNKGEYTASSSNAGLNLSGSPETGTNNPANGTAGSTLKGGLSGGGASDSGEAHGTTQSAIANATITITDEEQQKALTGKTAAETVATLNRDTQHANGSINNPYDAQKVAEQLEFLQLANEVILQPVAAQAAKWIGDTFPPDPNSPDKINVGKILAHATLGAAMSQLLGTGWESGAAAGALGDILPNVLAKAFEKDERGMIKDEAAFKAANVIISAALSSAAGGDLAQTINAGMITQNAVGNNYLSHQENLDRKKALLDCSAGNADACNQAEALNALDDKRDLDLHAVCDGASYSDACRKATIEMRQALGTYAAPTQANKPITLGNIEDDPLLSSYTNKDELQSYVPLIQVSNQKLTKEELGNALYSQSPNLYNGDPYGVINRDILQNYVVVKVGEQWMVIGSSEDQVYTLKAGVNGMQNPPIYAPALMGAHVENAYAGTSAYTLAYVPDNSFTMDLLLSLGDKVSLGGLTTSVEANFLSGVLQNVQANGEPVDWVAHSRGGAIFTQAVNITPSDLSNNSILFHAGANNELVTQGILNDAQIKYGIGTPGNEQPPYKNSDADLVPNIVGFNGNPIQWIKSILAIPDLSKGPLISPHTLPPGYIVAPPRYTTPYTESAP